jgi:hypothetical protein
LSTSVGHSHGRALAQQACTTINDRITPAAQARLETGIGLADKVSGLDLASKVPCRAETD